MPDSSDMKDERPRGGRIGRAWRMENVSNRRVRTLVRLGVVALVLVVLVVIPGYIALQPSFVQRYSNLSPEYKTWSTSVHANVPCQRCHVSPQPVDQAMFAAKMVGEF